VVALDKETPVVSALTAVCPEKGYRKVLDAIRSFPTAKVTLEGTEDTWDRLILMFPVGTMILTSMVRHAPGDRFSKLVLSMHNFFRTVEATATANKDLVLSRVKGAEMMIGVVAEPEFRDIDIRLECLWRIVEKLDAIIFNGEAMLNLRGERIMTRSGEHDVDVRHGE
jgi:hypothetical protein